MPSIISPPSPRGESRAPTNQRSTTHNLSLWLSPSQLASNAIADKIHGFELTDTMGKQLFWFTQLMFASKNNRLELVIEAQERLSELKIIVAAHATASPISQDDILQGTWCFFAYLETTKLKLSKDTKYCLAQLSHIGLIVSRKSTQR